MTEEYPGYKFELPGWSKSYKTGVPEVRFAAGLLELGLTREKVLGFTAFQNWIKTLEQSLDRQSYTTHTFANDPYYLRWIQIQAFDEFEPKGVKRVFFIKLFAQVTTESGKDYLPGVVFLRGGSVAVLMIVRPTDAPLERYVIMTEQARIAAGSLSFMEIPAGMLDDERNIKLAALREIEEEVGIFPKANDLIDMTELAVTDHAVTEDIRDAMYPSPGGCDEFINIFLWERNLDRLDIENLKDRLTGDRAAAEKITVRLLEYEKLVAVGARDGKTLAAWSLYEYLKRVHPEKLKPSIESVIKLQKRKAPAKG
ncbi:nudix hydrolase 14 [Cadophora sp. MPI-SDFR-AT-0126]|nr:nudix hydrolase 14 [Leotiomycetes sp. MPI-SDFR-AT-0126]